MTTRSISTLAGVAVLLFGIAGVVCAHLQPQLWLLWAVAFAVATACAILWAQRALRGQAREVARYVAASPRIPAAAPAVDDLFEPVFLATAGASQNILDQQKAMQESRHQLEALLEGMQDAVLGVDAAGRVQWSNAQMQRLMDRGSGSSSVRHGRALVHTFRDPPLLETVQTTLDQRIVSECRSEGLLPGRIFDVNAAPLPGGGAVVVLHDSTRAEQMERTQRDFVANVSH